MSAQRYIKWSLYLETLGALHWNDGNESPKYEYTSIKRQNNYISHDRLNVKPTGPRDEARQGVDVNSMPHCVYASFSKGVI